MISPELYNNVICSYKEFRFFDSIQTRFKFIKENTTLLHTKVRDSGSSNRYTEKWIIVKDDNLHRTEIPLFTNYTEEELFQYSLVQEFNLSIFDVFQIQKEFYSTDDLSKSFFEYKDITFE